MSDKREVDLKNKLDEATNADQEKKAFLKNFFEDEEPLNKLRRQNQVENRLMTEMQIVDRVPQQQIKGHQSMLLL